MPVSHTIVDVEDRDIAILRIVGELDFDARPDFQSGLSELLASPRSKLVIDLSRIQRMSSVFIGTIIDFGHKAQSEHRSLTCIMVQKMANVCRDAGMESVASIVIAKS